MLFDQAVYTISLVIIKIFYFDVLENGPKLILGIIGSKKLDNDYCLKKNSEGKILIPFFRHTGQVCEYLKKKILSKKVH
jgi:hypothetical protein